MVKIFSFILFCGAAIAQSSTNDVYLFCRNATMATNATAQLDSALGYPNPATKTFTAVNYISNGTNALVRISYDLVWSPRLNKYVDVADIVHSKLSDVDWGTNILSSDATLADLAGRNFARVDGTLAKKIYKFLDQTSQ